MTEPQSPFADSLNAKRAWRSMSAHSPSPRLTLRSRPESELHMQESRMNDKGEPFIPEGDGWRGPETDMDRDQGYVYPTTFPTQPSMGEVQAVHAQRDKREKVKDSEPIFSSMEEEYAAMPGNFANLILYPSLPSTTELEKGAARRSGGEVPFAPLKRSSVQAKGPPTSPKIENCFSRVREGSATQQQQQQQHQQQNTTDFSLIDLRRETVMNAPKRSTAVEGLRSDWTSVKPMTHMPPPANPKLQGLSERRSGSPMTKTKKVGNIITSIATALLDDAVLTPNQMPIPMLPNQMPIPTLASRTPMVESEGETTIPDQMPVPTLPKEAMSEPMPEPMPTSTKTGILVPLSMPLPTLPGSVPGSAQAIKQNEEALSVIAEPVPCIPTVREGLEGNPYPVRIPEPEVVKESVQEKLVGGMPAPGVDITKMPSPWLPMPEARLPFPSTGNCHPEITHEPLRYPEVHLNSNPLLNETETKQTVVPPNLTDAAVQSAWPFAEQVAMPMPDTPFTHTIIPPSTYDPSSLPPPGPWSGAPTSRFMGSTTSWGDYPTSATSSRFSTKEGYARASAKKIVRDVMMSIPREAWSHIDPKQVAENLKKTLQGQMSSLEPNRAAADNEEDGETTVKAFGYGARAKSTYGQPLQGGISMPRPFSMSAPNIPAVTAERLSALPNWMSKVKYWTDMTYSEGTMPAIPYMYPSPPPPPPPIEVAPSVHLPPRMPFPQMVPPYPTQRPHDVAGSFHLDKDKTEWTRVQPRRSYEPHVDTQKAVGFQGSPHVTTASQPFTEWYGQTHDADDGQTGEGYWQFEGVVEDERVEGASFGYPSANDWFSAAGGGFLPPGWIAEFDQEHQAWYFVNLELDPPLSVWNDPRIVPDSTQEPLRQDYMPYRQGFPGLPVPVMMMTNPPSLPPLPFLMPFPIEALGSQEAARAMADLYAQRIGGMEATRKLFGQEGNKADKQGPVAAELERERKEALAARRAYDHLSQSTHRLATISSPTTRPLQDQVPSSRTVREVEKAEEGFARGQGMRDRIRVEDALRMSSVPVALHGYDGPTRGWDAWAGARSRTRYTDRRVERWPPTSRHVVGPNPTIYPGGVNDALGGYPPLGSNSNPQHFLPDGANQSVGMMPRTWPSADTFPEPPAWTNRPGWTFARAFAPRKSSKKSADQAMASQFTNPSGLDPIRWSTQQIPSRNALMNEVPRGTSMPTAVPVPPGASLKANSKGAVTPYGMPEYVSSCDQESQFQKPSIGEEEREK